MLTTALASLPTTTADALTAIGEGLTAWPSIEDKATRLAILTHPNAPAGINRDWGTLDVHDALFALADPNLPASAREAILGTGATLAAVAAQCGPVTSAELTAAYGDRVPTVAEATHLLLAPATPHALAGHALDALQQAEPTKRGRLTDALATAILESGVARPGINATIDAYLHAHAADPDLTWAAHSITAAGKAPRAPFALAIVGETTRYALTACELMASGGRARSAVAVNPRLPELLRVEALDAAAAHGYPSDPTFGHLSDTATLTALDKLGTAAQHAVASAMLANPNRGPETITTVFEMLYPSMDTLFPDAAIAIALHPNCPPGLRDRAAVRARHEARAAVGLMFEPETILTVPLPALRAVTAPTAFLTAHIADALTAKGVTATAEQARVVALLEPTFTGTPRELLEAAAGISA